jgi:hypothetical protein
MWVGGFCLAKHFVLFSNKFVDLSKFVLFSDILEQGPENSKFFLGSQLEALALLILVKQKINSSLEKIFFVKGNK